MLDFYKTGAGRRFCDSTVPDLVEQMKRLADEMCRANNLKEMELKNIGPLSATTPGDIAKEFIQPTNNWNEDTLFVEKILKSVDSEGGSIILLGEDYEKIRGINIRGMLLAAGVKIEQDDDMNEATLTKDEGG